VTDVFSRKERSKIMAKVRGRENAATELKLMSLLRAAKITGWRRHFRVFGNPDFVFRKSRVAVFVDGCFWHGCPVHGTMPASNRTFWQAKLDRNIQRDRLVARTLKASGWRVVRIWQHDLRDPKKVMRRISNALERAES
jgi:DNA mismatch endonuclease (patch repair protein)